jgi:hypothetical protein
MMLSKRTYLVLFTALLISAFFLLAVFPPKAPRTFLNHRRAVESIRNLNVAEHNYAALHPDVGFACSIGDLVEQASASTSKVGFVDGVLASGTKASYHFGIECTQNGSQKTTAYTITAVPTQSGTGIYALCTDQSGEIWYSENGLIPDCFAKRKPIEQKYR